MGIVRNLAMAGAVFSTIVVSSPTVASTWNIVEVLQGSDGGFGASGFHDSSGANPMVLGPQGELGKIEGSGILGEYDDVLGTFSGVFGLDGIFSFSLESINLFFGVDGFLSAPATMELDISGLASGTTLGTYMGASTTTDIGFKSMLGGVCCGGAVYTPNSFTIVDIATAYIALWGANGFNSDDQTYNNSTVGLDLRLRLVLSDDPELPSEVPIPASLPLFGTGLALMGYLGWRKKRKA